jgi:hypothetical protein
MSEQISHNAEYSFALARKMFTGHRGQASIAESAFDSGAREGAARERERIIKLIEKWWQDDETNQIGLIALIKGENE